jgi:hypothetical protein
MKHLKKFENFDFGHRFSSEEDQIKPLELDQPDNSDETDDIYSDNDISSEEDYSDDEENCASCGDDSDEEEESPRTWGDEVVVENIVSFKQFEAKKQDKKEIKKPNTKKEITYDKSGLKHPEKADLNKNKKISGYEKVRGKAIQDAVQDEKEEKGSEKAKENKGLTAAQNKLPEGLRKAIEAKNKKK